MTRGTREILRSVGGRLPRTVEGERPGRRRSLPPQIMTWIGRCPSDAFTPKFVLQGTSYSWYTITFFPLKEHGTTEPRLEISVGTLQRIT